MESIPSLPCIQPQCTTDQGRGSQPFVAPTSEDQGSETQANHCTVGQETSQPGGEVRTQREQMGCNRYELSHKPGQETPARKDDQGCCAVCISGGDILPGCWSPHRAQTHIDYSKDCHGPLGCGVPGKGPESRNQASHVCQVC